MFSQSSVKYDAFGSLMYEKNTDEHAKLAKHLVHKMMCTSKVTVSVKLTLRPSFLIFVFSCWAPQGDMPTNETMKHSNVAQFCCFVFVCLFVFFCPL